MAVPIPTNQIENLQQIEAVVAGPDGANRLYTVAGQLNINFGVNGQPNSYQSHNETFTALIGPVFTRRQFIRAICSASLAGTAVSLQGAAPYNVGWGITDNDADWDDDSGQVKLIVGVSINILGASNSTNIGRVAFQATILAEM